MRKILLLLLFLSISCFGAAPIARVLYNDLRQPSDALLDILQEFNIQHDGTWECIVKETQKSWIRKEGKERWDLPQMASLKEHYLLFSKIKMVDTITEEEKNYDYALVLGATIQRVRKRLFFLKTEWEKGLRFSKLVFLTGDRPLNPDFENEKAITHSPYPIRKGWTYNQKMPRNETEMMELVYDQMDLPEEMRKAELIVIDTPQKNNKRPNTKDTFHEWLKTQPIDGKALVISDQPFLGRADTVARFTIPSTFDIETIGEGFTWKEYHKEKRALSIILDELARWIYEERHQKV